MSRHRVNSVGTFTSNSQIYCQPEAKPSKMGTIGKYHAQKILRAEGQSVVNIIHQIPVMYICP